MKLKYSTKSLMDMDTSAEHIQKNSSRAALRFIEAVEITVERLLQFPEFGAVWESNDPELQGLRVCLVKGFPKYLVFYRIKGDEIVVTRILHGHRNLAATLKE